MTDAQNLPPQRKMPDQASLGLWLALLTAAAIGPWLFFYLRESINFNEIWLTKCAINMLQGKSQILYCYESNPPFSIAAQIIPALIVQIFKISPLIVIPLNNFFMVAASTVAVAAIVKPWPVVSRPQYLVLISTYLIAGTVLAGKNFGERDQIVLFGLFPFVLIQLGLTFQWRVLKAPARWLVLMLGALTIMIKPHYGLLPVILLLYRMITQKRLSVVLDSDFIALALAVVIYGLVIKLFFPDFAGVILPDTLRLYVLQPGLPVLPVIFEVLAAMVFTICLMIFLRIPFSFLCGVFLGAGLLCLIPYGVQNKGWSYHLVPTLTFLCEGMALALLAFLEKFSFSMKRAVLATCLIAGCSAYIVEPLNFAAPTSADYKNHPLTKLAERGGPGCSFFMFDFMRVVQSVAAYSPCTFASRFPVLWFAVPLASESYNVEHNLPHTLTADEVATLEHKYSAMVTEDFQRFKPDTVILARLRVAEEIKDPLDLPDFLLSHDSGFAAVWKNYRPTGQMVLPRLDLFKGTRYEAPADKIVYDIYEKIQ